MFPLKSDDIFRSDTRSPAFNVKLLFEQHLVHRMLVFLMSLLLLYVTVKTSVIVPYVVILSVRVVIILLELVNLYILLLVHLSVTNIRKSPKFTPRNSHSVDSSTSSFCVVSHRNIHRKRKLRKSSSFVQSAKNDDISNKFIVDRDKINVLRKPGNYYISSVFFLSALF